MALLTHLPTAEATRLGAAYGLDIASVEPQSGSVNSNFRLEAGDGSRFFLRIYEEQGFDGARSELRLLNELAQAGVPTVPPLTRADGARLSEFQGKPVAVFPWIQGEMFCQARVTPEASEKVGAALAEVHLATEALTRLPPGRFRVEDLYQRLDRIEQGAPTEYGDAARRVRSEIQRCVSERDPELPQGVIHGDLFRDNVLWEKGEIRALIDFESASHGAFLYDLMVTLLAWCFSDRFDADLVDAMLRGYSERRKLTLRELDAAVTECKLGCLRFATTRITDFAMRAPPGAAPARDYRRMLSRLEALESGALSPALARLRGR